MLSFRPSRPALPLLLLLLLLALASAASNSSRWRVGLPSYADEGGAARHHPIAFSDGVHGYILGGLANASDASVWRYNPQPLAATAEYGEWVELAGFAAHPGARTYAVGLAIHGAGYLGFGLRNGNITLRDLWRYDPPSGPSPLGIGTFARLASLPSTGEARYHPAMVAVECDRGRGPEHLIYVGCGSKGGSNGNLKDWWEYNVKDDAWTRRADLPGPARHHPYYWAAASRASSAAAGRAASRTRTYAGDDHAYVGLGHGSRAEGYIMRDVYRFDPKLLAWKRMNDFPQEGRVAGTQFSFSLTRGGGGGGSSGSSGGDAVAGGGGGDGASSPGGVSGAAAVSVKTGYVLSGDGDNHGFMDTGELWEYQPNDDSWVQLQAHPGRSRWAPGSFVINCTVYFTSGYDRSTKTLHADLMSFNLCDASATVSTVADPAAWSVATAAIWLVGCLLALVALLVAGSRSASAAADDDDDDAADDDDDAELSAHSCQTSPNSTTRPGNHYPAAMPPRPHRPHRRSVAALFGAYLCIHVIASSLDLSRALALQRRSVSLAAGRAAINVSAVTTPTPTLVSTAADDDSSAAVTLIPVAAHLAVVGIAPVIYVILGAMLMADKTRQPLLTKSSSARTTAPRATTTEDGRARAIRVAAPVGAALYAAFLVAMLCVSDEQKLLVLFGWYLAAAVFAFIGVIRFFRRHRHRRPASMQGRGHEGHDGHDGQGVGGTQEGPAATKETPQERRVAVLFLVGNTFGMVDFLIPAVAFLGVPVWQPGCLGRILDCVLYLPPAVIGYTWMDTVQGEYSGAVDQAFGCGRGRRPVPVEMMSKGGRNAGRRPAGEEEGEGEGEGEGGGERGVVELLKIEQSI